MDAICLFLVIPCYNEESVLGQTAQHLQEEMLRLIDSSCISANSRIVFVDDGSNDGTWGIIQQLHSQSNLFEGVKLSCNRGQQNALLAGLISVKDYAEVVITLDADLQDDISLFGRMIEKYQEGKDIVFAVRSSREHDTWFKRNSAKFFYSFMRFLDIQVIDNHAEYRLISKRALHALADFGETDIFLRGIVPLLGFSSSIITYARQKRLAGQSKFPAAKMLADAGRVITALSVRPLRMITLTGAFIFMISCLILLYSGLKYLICGEVTPVATITTPLILLGGVQLLSLGIIGEYVGRIHMESKKRPRYIVEDYLRGIPVPQNYIEN
jgi:glycosyltransferase involved in cell wall biosynthesis